MTAPCFPTGLAVRRPPLGVPVSRWTAAERRGALIVQVADEVAGPAPTVVRALARRLDAALEVAVDAGHADPLEVAAAQVLDDLARALHPQTRLELAEALAGTPWPGGTWRPPAPLNPGRKTGTGARRSPAPATMTP